MLSSRFRPLALIVALAAVLAVPAFAQQEAGDPAPPDPPPLTAPDTPRNPGQAGSSQPQPIDEFIPISELPPEEQLPAAPMLIAAYIFVVLALFAYLLSVSRRLGEVKQEITRLEAETRRTGQR